MHEILDTAKRAARAAGDLLMAEFRSEHRVDAREAHDIKLAIDREAQETIARVILGTFPGHALLGEEGDVARPGAEWEWIVDPLDGTVNYFYGIPHFCVSVAARHRGEIVAGAILDPARGELWEASSDSPALFGGEPCRPSDRSELSEAVLSVGFAKSEESIAAGLPLFTRMARSARKCRMMGSAALDIAYVACGRLDAYIESAVSLWDIAAGKIILERAGGRIEIRDGIAPGKLAVRAWNGRIPLDEPAP